MKRFEMRTKVAVIQDLVRKGETMIQEKEGSITEAVSLN